MPAHLLHTQQLLPDTGQYLLRLTLWRLVLPSDKCAHIRRRQRLPVHLPVRGQRHLLEPDERRRHHVSWQLRFQVRSQSLHCSDHHILLRTGLRFVFYRVVSSLLMSRPIRHQPLLAGNIFPRQHHRLSHFGKLGKPGLDLAQLYSQPSNLDLIIIPAQILDRAILVPTTQVARTVHPGTFPGSKRILHETLCRQLRPVQITSSHTLTTDVDLACHTDRHRLVSFIQYVESRVRYRSAYRYSSLPLLLITHPVRRIHCRLCRAIHVIEPALRKYFLETMLKTQAQLLTATEHMTQSPTLLQVISLQEHLQHRWHEVHHRNVLGVDQLHQILRIPMPLRSCHHQAGSVEQRPEELPDRYIEAERCLL